MVKFEARKYKWGYTLWVRDAHGFKHQIANKLKDWNAVKSYVGTQYVYCAKPNRRK